MHRSFFRSLLALALAGGALVLPAVATAQTRVVVLGIRSLEGDDEFARNLTGALRHAASQVNGWNVISNEVTLAQIALAHGCEEIDTACMAQVAQTLNVQRVVYGDVRRTSARAPFDFSLNLHLFNAETGDIEHSVTDTIPGVRRDIDDLREPVRRYIAALSGAPRVGTLHVSVNVPGAEVFIDGRSVGHADEDGRLDVTDVQAGSREVRVVAPGHQSFRSTVSVEPYGEASFEAELQVGTNGEGGGGMSPDIVLGAGLLVAAAGLAAGWIASWAHVRFGLSEDADFVQYRRDVGLYLQIQPPGPGMPRIEDACHYATSDNSTMRLLTPRGETEGIADLPRANRARDVCNEASVFEVLEFAFGIGAAVAAGVGTYFLVSGITGGDANEQAWMLTPSFGPDHGYLGVAARF
ncbi:MAG TPA: PEGA domain-containing protein [Sandaracinaceae bacterium]